MEKMRALIANDPRMYREVIMDALMRLRPLVEVVLAESEELEREVGRVRPHLVVCSRKIGAAVLRGAGCLCWVVLYPDGEDRLEIGEVGGDCTALLSGGVVVGDLLRVVDETELLCRRSEVGRRA